MTFLFDGGVIQTGFYYFAVVLIGCSFLTTLLIGVSRVYLGFHWPDDVLAGWAAGAAWAACWLMVQRDKQGMVHDFVFHWHGRPGPGRS